MIFVHKDSGDTPAGCVGQEDTHLNQAAQGQVPYVLSFTVYRRQQQSLRQKTSKCQIMFTVSVCIIKVSSCSNGSKSLHRQKSEDHIGKTSVLAPLGGGRSNLGVLCSSFSLSMNCSCRKEYQEQVFFSTSRGVSSCTVLSSQPLCRCCH